MRALQRRSFAIAGRPFVRNILDQGEALFRIARTQSPLTLGLETGLGRNLTAENLSFGWYEFRVI
jgi:hypothetical protein